MTRKDYVMIALAISEIRNSYIGSSMGHEDLLQRLTALDDVTVNLAEHLKTDNPAFHAGTFVVAAHN